MNSQPWRWGSLAVTTANFLRYALEGMDLVREIHEMPADGQNMDPPLSIQRAVRVH